MYRIKIAYYILLLISAVELGRGVQLISNPLFWDPIYPYARYTSLLQIIISAVLFIIARILKPKLNDKSL